MAFLGHYAIGDTLYFYLQGHYWAGQAQLITPNWDIWKDATTGVSLTNGTYTIHPGVNSSLGVASVVLSSAIFSDNATYVIKSQTNLQAVGGIFGKQDSFRIDSGLAGAREQMRHGLVNASPTATVFNCDEIVDTPTDHFKGRLIMFISGTLKGQVQEITGYTLLSGPPRGQFTVGTAFTAAPALDDQFIVV